MQNDLQNQFALITGAGSGIGKALSLALSHNGVNLILVGRDNDKLKAVQSAARSGAKFISCHSCDLHHDQEISSLCKHLQHEVEQIDILIHSAGIIHLGATSKMEIACFDELFQINLRAALLLTKGILPIMTSTHKQLVFINSSAALNPDAQSGIYAASKSAMKTIADSLRLELNSEGVRVLSVYPGKTASPMQSMVSKFVGSKYTPEKIIQPEDIASIVIHTLGLPWTIEVTDIFTRPFIPPSI